MAESKNKEYLNEKFDVDILKMFLDSKGKVKIGYYGDFTNEVCLVTEPESAELGNNLIELENINFKSLGMNRVLNTVNDVIMAYNISIAYTDKHKVKKEDGKITGEDITYLEKFATAKRNLSKSTSRYGKSKRNFYSRDY